jgi:hypothetical protein
VAIVALVLVGFHLAVASMGGLLAPAETELAQAARPGSEGIDRNSDQVDPLEPPLARWLAGAGLAMFGQSAASARLLPVLSSALLLLGLALLLYRFFGVRVALWVTLAMLTTPLWITRAGQISPETLTAVSVALTACCAAALSLDDLPGRSRLAALLGAMVALSLLAGGPAAAATSTIIVIGSLSLSPARDEDTQGHNTLSAVMVAVVGIILIVIGFRLGRTGWPMAVSLLRSGCPLEEGEASPIYPWVGTLLIAASLVVLRARRAKAMGLHLSAAVALVLMLPWLLWAWFSADTDTLCAMPRPGAMEFIGSEELAQVIRRMGYGLYPWMAFLPLGILRLHRSMLGEKDPEAAPSKALGLAIALWAAASLGLSFLGDTPSMPIIVTTVAALGALGGLGLATGMESTEVVSERTAAAAGGLLFLVVFRDLAEAPSLLTSTGLSGEATGVPPATGALFVGALVLLAIGLLVLGNPAPSKRWPKVIRRFASRSEFWGRVLTACAAIGCGFLILVQGVIPIATRSSWSEVFELLGEEREGDEPVFAYQELGADAGFYGSQVDYESIDSSDGVRRALSRTEDRVFFLTRTIYYRQLSGMINRMTGQHPRPINLERREMLLVVYEGPRPEAVSLPPPRVDEIPSASRANRAGLAGGAIQLAGADVFAEHARPGDTINVELYLKCQQRVSEDLSLRIHLSQEEGSGRALSTHAITEGRYPTSQWRVDDMVRSQIEVIVPTDAEAGRWEVEVEIPPGDRGRSRRERIGFVEIRAAQE